MQVGELFEIINKLTLSNAKHIYYCLPGTTLTLGIREIKTYSDMVEFMRIGHENDNRMELFTEHHGYGVLQYNHNDNLASDNEQSDVDPDYEGESDPDNVDFHTGGEQGVEFEKLSVDDPFLNKLVEDEIIDGIHKADKGIKYPAYDPEQPWNKNKHVLGMRYESPQQLKHALANYGAGNRFRLWYYRNDADCLLVFCGRDLSIGRCASKKKLSNRHNSSPQGKGKGETQGNGKREHQQKEKGKGSLVTFRWIAQHYGNEIIPNPSIPTSMVLGLLSYQMVTSCTRGQQPKPPKPCKPPSNKQYSRMGGIKITDVGGSVGRGGGSTSKRGGGSVGRGGGSTSKRGGGSGLGRGDGSVGRGGGSTSKRGGGSSVGRVDGSVGRCGGSVGRSGGSFGRGVGSVGRGGGSVGRFRKGQEAEREVMEEVRAVREKERLEIEQYARTYCGWEDLEWEGDGFEEPNSNLRLATMSDLVAANEPHDEHFNNTPSLTNDVSLDISHSVEGNNDVLLNNGAVSVNVALPINVAMHNNVVVPNNEQPTQMLH
uniref:Uncharacterized protein n=1 Tax=Tanacetum cinerariifolium TaxID=118510 RepID=A0A6L2KP41_TANCI|nr:hypothetical protein [Tanacetum cinerariifolium]